MKPTVWTIVLFAAAAAACGDNHAALDASPNPSDDGSGMDGGTIDGAGAPSTINVVAGDFTAGDPGIMTTVDDRSHSTAEDRAPGAIGDDPVSRLDAANGVLYVINRADSNNLVQLDTAFQNIQQFSTGSGTNPQDVAVVGTKFYVATLAGDGLEVFDTSGSGSAFTPIALGSDDPDGQPNCNSAFAVGTNVYVSCELLDNTKQNLPPRGNGVVKVIDTSTDTVATTIKLTEKNPFGQFELLPDGNLAIATVDFTDGAGCVLEVDTTANTAACMAGLNNTDLGGLFGGSDATYASRMSITGDQKTMLIASPAPDFSSALLVSYDFASTTLGTPVTPVDEVIGDVTACPDGNIAVTDTGSAAGVRIYRGSAELTTTPITIGLAPLSAHGLQCY
jgi:hypothetical protein|nr:hypothetical protein [Kofleriaceae bacterium]